MDRTLKVNTVKCRTYSFFRQGRAYLRGAIGKLRNGDAALWNTFRQLFSSHPECRNDYAIL